MQPMVCYSIDEKGAHHDLSHVFFDEMRRRDRLLKKYHDFQKQHEYLLHQD